MYNGWGIFCEVEDYLSWLYIHRRWRHHNWHNNVYYVHASRVNGAYFARLKIISLHYTYIGDSSLQFLRYRLCFSSFEIVGVRLRKHGNRSGSCIHKMWMRILLHIVKYRLRNTHNFLVSWQPTLRTHSWLVNLRGTTTYSCLSVDMKSIQLLC